MFTTPLSNPCWVMVSVGPVPVPIQPSFTASRYGSDHTAVPFQRWYASASTLAAPTRWTSVAGPKLCGPAFETQPFATAQRTCGRAQNAAAVPGSAGVWAPAIAVGRMTGTPCQNDPGAGAGTWAAAAVPSAVRHTPASTAATTTRERLAPSTVKPERPILHQCSPDV